MRSEIVARMRGIYVIVDPEHTNGRDVIDVAKTVYSAGASTVQLRYKNAGKRGLVEQAREIQQIAHDTGKIFIVNDHADVSRIADTDGLHVGQKDLRVTDCRAILDDRQLIGTSNALLEEALESQNDGADYIAVGAMFSTGTKLDTRPAGVETLVKVREAVDTHLVAIGGINSANIEPVVKGGADSICVASAITKSDDMERATSELVELFERFSA